jgi:hypothetical protein
MSALRVHPQAGARDGRRSLWPRARSARGPTRAVEAPGVRPGRVRCQWDSWRRSAQKVTRAWSEWLATDGRQRPELFGCYVRALTEEEQAAAELERMLHLGARGRPA